MRLLSAVAGVLLILDINQAKAAVHLSRSTTYNQKQLLDAARVENNNAIRVLNKSLIPKDSLFEITRNALLKTQNYLNKLLRKKTGKRVETLTETLDSELLGFFGSTKCKDLSECNQTFKFVQQATGDIIGAILKENTLDGTKKNHIKDIIRGNITEEGDIEKGASVQQTYEVAVKVWFCLRGFCRPN